jgi:hypothetical protein
LSTPFFVVHGKKTQQQPLEENQRFFSRILQNGDSSSTSSTFEVFAALSHSYGTTDHENHGTAKREYQDESP